MNEEKMTAMLISGDDTSRPPRRRVQAVLAKLAPLGFLFALIVVFSLLNHNFLEPSNLFNVMRQVSITGLIALGMTFVILTGGIDLSVGSILALAGILAAIVAKGFAGSSLSLDAEAHAGAPWCIAMAAALATGAVCGGAQGIAITRLKVPPFVVTLGGLSAFRGLTLWVSGAGPISGFDPSIRWWGQGLIGPVPVPVILFLAAAVICHVVLSQTRYGRQIYAVGGNQEAAHLVGIANDRILVSVYVIVGALAGLAGFILMGRLNTAEAIAGSGYELTVIAAVVIGGTSLFGGSGSVAGTMIGAILIGVLVNGLVLLNVSSYIQQVIVGLMIVAAVGFDRFVASLRE
jgi:ribose/xylose/arabinose/galactoside ABC-type transport system permease subunit